MKGHAEKQLEFHCELADKPVDQLSKVSRSDHQSTKDDIEMVGELADECALILHERSTRHFLDNQCVSSGCRDMEQSDRQKVGESHKLSLMHFGSSAILSCW